MKTKEELFALRNEVELLNTKLCELSDDELAQVTGGISNLAYRVTRVALGAAGFEPGVKQIYTGEQLGYDESFD